jgi:uncharacterized membrane protein
LPNVHPARLANRREQRKEVKMMTSTKILVLGCALLAATASPSLAAGCVEITANTSPESVCPGGVVTVNASVRNCGDVADKITVTASTAGGSPSGQASRTMRIAAGGTVQMSQTVRLPASLSEGSYTITFSVSSKDGAKAVHNLSVEVTSCR